MTRLRMMLWRFLALFKRANLEGDLDLEIRSHIEMQTADHVRSGMTEKEARQAALRAFGPVDRVKEIHRDTRGFVLLEQAWKDIRRGLHGLAKSPGFTVFAALTLAVGVGANTTVFNAYNAIALKPLPVVHADRVVRLKRWFESRTLGNQQRFFSYLEYVHVRDHNNGAFSELAIASRQVTPVSVLPANAVPLSASGQLQGQLVSATFFTDLGVAPRVGRGFLAGEDSLPGGNPVVVLSNPFWKRAFSSDPQALGQVIRMNGIAFTIIGVAPPEFTGTGFLLEAVPDFWAPLSMQAQLAPDKDWLNDPGEQAFQILGRLQPRASLAQAQSQTDALIRQFDSTLQDSDRTKSVTLQHAVLWGDTDDPRFTAIVAAFMVVVGLILVAACTNIANMFLARCAVRQREIGVRMALGSSRGRIVRQLLTESLLVSVLGGLTGLALATWTSRLLEVKLTERMVSLGGRAAQVNLNPDARVFAYALAITVVTGLLFGLSPAIQFSKSDLTSAFKEEGSPLSLRVNRSRLRASLTAMQVAISMFLLISTGLLVRGLARSQGATDPGFELHERFFLLADFGPYGTRYTASRAALQRRLFEALRPLPEFEAVALGSAPGDSWSPPIAVGGQTPGTSVQGRTLASYASDAYFDFFGITLLRGRHFTSREVEAGSPASVISETTARHFWPNEDAIGRHFQLRNFQGGLSEYEVVGIVKDVRFANLSRLDPAHVYLTAGPNTDFHIFLKTRSGSQTLPAIQAAAATVDKALLPSLSLIGLDEVMTRQLGISYVSAALGGILAVISLLLAGSGIYGVMAYLVTQRTREIGIRISVGATSVDVLNGVILHGLRPVFIGMILGLGAAGGLSLILHATLVIPGSMDFLYGLPFYDPLTFVGFSCFVLGLAALASFVPARRALAVDPMISLRHG